MSSSTEHWPLMGSSFYPVVTIFIYLGLLKYVRGNGNEGWMELGEKLMKWHYLVLGAVNCLMIVNFISIQCSLGYSPWCEPPSKGGGGGEEGSQGQASSRQKSWLFGLDAGEKDTGVAELEARLARCLWTYMLSKVLDCGDHILYELQGRPTRWLDIGHHITMIGFAWLGVRFYPGGSTAIWASINCGFDAVAYSYQTLRKWDENNDGFWDQFRAPIHVLKYIHFFLAALHCLTVIYCNCGYSTQATTYLLAFVGGFSSLYAMQQRNWF